MKKTHRITLIEGDGIGPEICAEVKKIAVALPIPLQFEFALAGQKALEATGELLPAATLRSIQKNRVALKGPITTPIGKGFKSLNVTLRKKFELYANVRPVLSLKGISRYSDVDLVIIRENTEGLYAGLEHELVPGVVESIKVVTKKASERIARYAFEYAREQRRKKISVIHKANILKLSDGLFLKCAQGIAKRYPEIQYEELIVDNACLQLVTRPQDFDILLMENLYGDILSDLCAGLVGGLGVVPGANIGKNCAIFEAVHGSAPDIAGKGVANPTAIILSFAMLLGYLGESKAADRVEQAVRQVLASPKTRTRDLGGKLTTSQLGDTIAKAIS